jgi:hypothetical protein
MHGLRRLVGLMLAAGLLVVLTATPALAHGIGGRGDLPVPLSYFIVGAGAAIVISFLALAVLWPVPRLQDGARLRPLEARWILPALRSLGWVGLAALALVIADGFIAGNRTTRHISPVMVWVVFWLVVPYLSAIVGNLWRWGSPFRLVAEQVNGARPERDDLGLDLGIWPATAAFVAFTWLELVSLDSSSPETLAIAALAYTLYLMAVTRWLGVETGLTVGGAFENYFGLISAIAPIELVPEAAGVGTATAQRTAVPAWRGWLRGLPTYPIRRGTTWFVLATIGTVTYDGLSSAEWWGEFFGETATTTWFGTVALVATVVVVGGAYFLASAIAARLAGAGWTAAAVADSFVHTLIPIALAYAFSHYFTLVIFEGQQLLHAASEPFGLDWNLFGAANWRMVFWMSPTAIWFVQLISIVVGHIAGTVLAHDRALDVFGDEVAVRTQYAMLVLMVALTSLGLFILAG